MHKYQAMRIVNDFNAFDSLTISNTHFANDNAGKTVWWLNIPPQRFKQDLHVLLAKDQGSIWLRIESNTFPNPERVFKMRPDKGVIDLEISSNVDDRYLQDIKSGGTFYDFRRHVEHEWDA